MNLTQVNRLKVANLIFSICLQIKAKNLPQDRLQHEPLEYGVREPERVQAGKLTLRMFDNLWNEYKTNKTPQHLNDLSKKYNVDIEKLNLLIEYYKPFKVHVKQNDKEDKKNSFELPISELFSNLKHISSETKSLNQNQSNNNKN